MPVVALRDTQIDCVIAYVIACVSPAAAGLAHQLAARSAAKGDTCTPILTHCWPLALKHHALALPVRRVAESGTASLGCAAVRVAAAHLAGAQAAAATALLALDGLQWAHCTARWLGPTVGLL